MQIVKILLVYVIITPLNAAHNGSQTHENIILSKGEHHEIKMDNLKRFSVGNGEIVTKSFNEKTNTLLLKGQKIGFTEIIVWDKQNLKKSYRVYVLSKQKYLTILHLAQTLRSLGLIIETSGALILAKGTLESLESYHLLVKILKDNEKFIHLKIDLSPDLQKTILEDIYHYFFEEYIDEIQCEARGFLFGCQYSQSNPPSKELLEKIKEKYHVNFFALKDHDPKKNYRIKLKIVQLEKMDGEELNLGLSHLSTSLGDLIEGDLKKAIGSNSIVLKNENIDISTLAEPESIIRANTPINIQIGAEIPYQEVQDEKISTTKWKFSGLRVKVKLTHIGNRLELQYETEVTRGDEESGVVQGSKESSSVVIEPAKPVQLFQIGFKTVGLKSNRLPYISRIPILGKLFYSKSNQENYKKITGIVVLEEI